MPVAQSTVERDAAASLSVIVPNFNHARYLPQSLSAFLNQSWQPAEIIVIDDKSEDDSCAVVEGIALANPTVRLVRKPCREGVNAALNRGLTEARGEYIYFASADDLVGPDFVERSLGALLQFPDAAFCFSDPAEMIGDTGEIRRFSLFLSDRPIMLSPKVIVRLIATNYFTFSANTVMYRRERLAELRGHKTALEWHADWFTNLVLAFRFGACYVPGALAFFRLNEASYSSRGARQTARQVALTKLVFEALLSPDFRDVMPAFRDAATVPVMSLHTLWLVFSTRKFHPFLTPRLASRVVLRVAWGMVRDVAPVSLRLWLRARAGSLWRRRRQGD